MNIYEAKKPGAVVLPSAVKRDDPECAECVTVFQHVAEEVRKANKALVASRPPARLPIVYDKICKLFNQQLGSSSSIFLSVECPGPSMIPCHSMSFHIAPCHSMSFHFIN